MSGTFEDELGAVAGGTINQFRFVKLTTLTGNRLTVVECTAATDIPFGVSKNDGVTGDPMEIVTLGIARVEVSEAISSGNMISTTTDGSGNLDITTADVMQMGMALQDASGDGSIIEVLIRPMGMFVTT